MPQHKDTFDPVQTIHDFAPYYGVPVDLALKVLQHESGGRHYATSGHVLTSARGARGYMQLLPSTARSLGFDPDNPEDNIHAGLKYLGQNLKHFNGNQALALAGYHSGTEHAEAALKNPRGNPRTYSYVRSILGPDFSKHWPPKGSAEPSFTDLIEQMKTDKQGSATEPTFDDLINQMKSEKQPQASPGAPEHESAPDAAAEPDATGAGKEDPQPGEEAAKESSEDALMQQLVQHLEEARASGTISEDLYNAMKPTADQ